MDKGFGERLAALRQGRGHSQEQVAMRLGVTRQAISRWERGESIPDIDNLVSLAGVYQTSVDELLGVRHATEGSDAAIEKEPSGIILQRNTLVVIACIVLLLAGALFALMYKPTRFGFMRGEIVSVVHPAAGYTSNELVVKNESGAWGETVYLVFTPGENTRVTEQGENADVQSLRVGDVVDVRFEIATKDVDNPYELPALIQPDTIEVVESPVYPAGTKLTPSV